MKRVVLISFGAFILKTTTAQIAGWMSRVVSWNAKITLSYVDSINVSNYTRLDFVATGIIKDEVGAANAHMTWPLAMNPVEMKRMRATGQYTKKVTEDAPPVNRVEEYTCTATVDELIFGGITATLDGKYAVSVGPPQLNTLTCTGKGIPDKENWNHLFKFPDESPFTPASDETFIGGDAGSSSRNLAGSIVYKTSSGATVTISWIFQPMAKD